MEIIKTDIEGVVILEPRVFEDARGYFFESYSKKVFDELAWATDFVQDNESMSTCCVMRGLHFQYPPYTQSKLVRCVRGKVLDVAVDIRKGSAVLRAERVRSRLRRFERRGGIPIQMRQLLRAAGRWRNFDRRRLAGHRLAHRSALCDFERKGSETSVVERFRLSV